MKLIRIFIIWIKSLFRRKKESQYSSVIKPGPASTPYSITPRFEHSSILPKPEEKSLIRKNNRRLNRGRRYQYVNMCDGTTRIIRHYL